MIATKDVSAQIASYSLTMLGNSCDVETVATDVITYRETDPLLLAFLLAVKQREGLKSLDEADALMRKRIRLKRTDIGEIHGKQVEQMQEVVAAKMAGPFLRSVQETARRIAKRTDKPDPENAEKQAERIVKATFDLEKANLEIFTAAAETLPVVFAAGVMAELVILEAVKGSKQTSAQEIAQRLEIDTALLPFSIGRMPEWLLEAAREASAEAFAQDYWQDIGETTRDDIQVTARQGIEDGLSMRKVAALIAEKHGGLYSKTRAMRVARTETPHMLLAGHAKGISQLEEETGFPIGKEWLSAFQTFTRPSHKALDSKRTKDAKGMFTLNGVQTPWPAHTNLPAKDRVNCLCNIISTVSADGLEDVSQAAEAELTGEPKSPVDTAEERRLAMLKAVKGGKKDRDSSNKRLAQLEKETIADFERLSPLEQKQWTGKLTEPEKKELDELKSKADKRRKEMQAIKNGDVVLSDKDRRKAHEALFLPKDQQTKLDANFMTGKFSDEYKKKANEAVDFLGKLTRKSGADANNVQFHASKQRRAGQVAGKGKDAGVHINEAVDGKVFVHEVGHHLQEHLPGASERVNEFLRSRTSGTKSVDMKKKFGGYGADEKGNPDDFLKSFSRDKSLKFGDAAKKGATSRDKTAAENAAYMGKTYEGGQTEVLSMGLEMLHENPIQLAERDPELFNFVLGVLDGTNR